MPHGSKTGWAAEQGVSVGTLATWRKAYVFGDLAEGLVPRDTSGMEPFTSARMAQLEKQLAEHKKQLVAEKAARLADEHRHQAEVARLEAVSDALGKAIGLLHDRAAEQEPTDES